MQVIVKEELTANEKAQVWGLLQEADSEFVPPLSVRNGSRQADFNPDAGQNDGGLAVYYESIINQYFVLALEEGEVLGFMSYLANYSCSALAPVRNSFYLTTLVVAKQHRGRKITRKLYRALIAAARKAHAPVATRTWGTNYPHIKILRELGFVEASVWPDHRGPGVDTIYYCLPFAGP